MRYSKAFRLLMSLSLGILTAQFAHAEKMTEEERTAAWDKIYRETPPGTRIVLENFIQLQDPGATPKEKAAVKSKLLQVIRQSNPKDLNFVGDYLWSSAGFDTGSARSLVESVAENSAVSEKDRIDVLTALHAKGVDMNLAGENSAGTLTELASQHGAPVSTMEALVKMGAKVDGTNPKFPPIDMAVALMHADALKKLLALGANASYVDPKTDNTLLISLASVGEANTLDKKSNDEQVEMAKMLLAKKVPLNATNKVGRNAAEIAIMHGHFELAKYLFERGSNFNAYSELEKHNASKDMPDLMNKSFEKLDLSNPRDNMAAWISIANNNIHPNTQLADIGKTVGDYLSDLFEKNRASNPAYAAEIKRMRDYMVKFDASSTPEGNLTHEWSVSKSGHLYMKTK